MRRGVVPPVSAAVVLLAALSLAIPALAGVPIEDGVELGGVFGRAVANATALTDDTIELRLEVEADDDVTVVAHLIEPGGPQETLPMASRGPGLFGIQTEVRKTDYLVVFEVIDGAVASQSQPLRLTDLGVDPALVGILTVPPIEDEDMSETTRQWGWAGLGLAAAALTLIALWALPDRRRRVREAEATAAAETDAAVVEASTAESPPDKSVSEEDD